MCFGGIQGVSIGPDLPTIFNLTEISTPKNVCLPYDHHQGREIRARIQKDLRFSVRLLRGEVFQIGSRFGGCCVVQSMVYTGNPKQPV